MARPTIKGTKKKRKQYKRVRVEYGHKQEIITYLGAGHTPSEALDYFYGTLTGKERRSKQQLISKWRGNDATIKSACESGHSRHLNLRKRGTATVLSKEAEEEIVLWINSLRKDGAPVSRTMMKLKDFEVAEDCGLTEDQFSASPSWIKLFMRRQKLSLQSKTRQGQTTPEDAAQVSKEFRSKVLQTIVEQKCVQVFNAD
ncbi:Tc5 transposase DNA-binding domain [Phytophthora infestans]|uniref:Tc5 transposase DNA-binding domain n=1 Tax=Phytophthora infestans TaxID=4787 RepID=A0A8S9UJ28_PHYIN|nr:Tc5 transposase DNA-binding domain [Phytophthora infestans]